jgi:tetratricopeptide (TPR) repeat protein
LTDQGDLPGALKNYRDALAIRDQLTKEDPSNAGWQRDLSVSYEKVGDGLSAQGDLPGALKNYRDSLAIRDQLTKEDPSNAGWQRDLSVSYEKTGEVLRAQGDLPGALKNYRETLAIRDKLASQYPGNAGWQGDLAFSYFRIGTTLARIEPNSKSDAREMIRKARDILRRLKERVGLNAQQQGWLNAIESAAHDNGE